MNKQLKIVLIILLSFIAIGLGTFLFILINNNFQFDSDFVNIFGGQSNTLIENKEYTEVKDIYINSNVADVYINNSEDNKIKVELYSDNVKEHNISLNNDDLKIELKENNKRLFFSKHARIVLYVPSDYSNQFNITNSTGDIESSAYVKASFKINVNSGDVEIDKADSLDITTITGDIINNKVNTIKAKCTTGDIELDRIDKSLNLKTTTGDIKIDTINLSENSNIQTTTGEVTINNKNNIYVETETTTGDVKVNDNDRFAELTLHIKVTTGDIKVG